MPEIGEAPHGSDQPHGNLARHGFSSREIYEIALAVSEVARNIVSYAGLGEVSFGETEQGGRLGLIIVARDRGPGIADIDQVDLVSAPGQGTTVTMIKWRGQN